MRFLFGKPIYFESFFIFRPIREAWIKAKYLNRQFVRPQDIDELKSRTNTLATTKRKKSQLVAVPTSIEYKRRNVRALSTSGDIRTPIRPVRLIHMKHFCSSPSIPQLLVNGAVPTLYETDKPADDQPVRLSSFGSESMLNKADDGKLCIFFQKMKFWYVFMCLGDQIADQEAYVLKQNQILLRASKDADLKSMCLALAKGACVNYSCRDSNNLTPLHEAVSSVSTVRQLFVNFVNFYSRLIFRVRLKLASIFY